jgi:hypothetical protein
MPRDLDEPRHGHTALDVAAEPEEIVRDAAQHA